MIRKIIHRWSFGTIVLLIVLVIGWISLLINQLGGDPFTGKLLNVVIIAGIAAGVLWGFLAFYDYTVGTVRDT